MKSLAHLAGFSLALVLAGLGSGCASSSTASYRQPVSDFEVVETSAKRPLTDTEMAEVRASVGTYLDREGATDSGDYFVKVYLTPENVDAEPEWVVVRFTRYTAQRVALVSAHTYDDPTYSPYYSYDIYPYGYGSVSRIAFQYYVDPFYHRRYYHYPRRGHGGHKGDHDHDNGNHHGGKPGNPPGQGGPGPNTPRGPQYSENRPGLPQNRPVDGEYRGQRPRRTNPGERDPNLAQGQGSNPGDSRPASSGGTNFSGRPGVTQPPRTGPNRREGDSRPQNYGAANPTPSTQRPAVTQTQQQRRNRPEGTPNPNRAVNPQRTEARRDPPANRPAGYRPSAQQPARNSQPAAQPARNYQQPARSAPQPARTAPPSSGGDRRQADGQNETLR